MHGSERLKSTWFCYAATCRPCRQLRKRVAFNGAQCRALGVRAAASRALPAALCWRGEAFRAWLRAWQANPALVRAQNRAQLPPSRHSAALPRGQYSAKVGVLGSATALPNPFIMMGKGPEEVEDLLGVRSLHLALAPHAHCRARWECKAHARHVEPNGSNGRRFEHRHGMGKWHARRHGF